MSKYRRFCLDYFLEARWHIYSFNLQTFSFLFFIFGRTYKPSIVDAYTQQKWRIKDLHIWSIFTLFLWTWLINRGSGPQILLI